MLNPLAKAIAGEIALAQRPGEVLRKWRETFGLRQNEVAQRLGVSQSVISDYEKGRRVPGSRFIRKFVDTLLRSAERDTVEELDRALKVGAIVAIREFLEPVPLSSFVETLQGEVVTRGSAEEVWGYTLIDSIRAILELSGDEYQQIYGLNPQRALIFTKVRLGRSPMVAIRVSQLKPSVVMLHGLAPAEVDELAIEIARVEDISLIVSTIPEQELIRCLERL